MRQAIAQLGWLTMKHLLEWWRFRSGCYAMMLIPFLLVVVSFGPYNLEEAENEVDYQLDQLMHPIYPIGRLDPLTDTWQWGQRDSAQQQKDMQSFMWYNNYTNIYFNNRTDSYYDSSENQTEAYAQKQKEFEHKQGGRYDPSLDIFGPNSFAPLHCYTADKSKKYSSPIIGYIDNGSQITRDVVQQLEALFTDQTFMKELVIELDDFLQQLQGFLNPITYLTGVDPVEDADPDASEKLEPFNLNQTANVMVQQFLGEAVLQTEAPNFDFGDVIDMLGLLRFRAFESKQAIDDYVSQKGYGWDADKPGLCYAFGVTENDAGNKFELELFFNDQYPEMQAGIPLQQLDASPLSDDVEINYYMKYQYNGFSYMQHFVANTILQRKTSPDAMIVNMIMPQNLKPYKFNQQADAMIRVLKVYYVLVFVPVIVIMSYQMLAEKESGVKQRFLEAGVHPITHALSWWLFFLVEASLHAIFIGITFWSVAYYDASGWLIILYFFLANFSILTLVWALQPFVFSKHQSALVFVFAFLVLLAPDAYIDQTHLPVTREMKKFAALSPMVAAQETFNLITKMSSFKFGLNFHNFSEEGDNFSVKLGLQMLALDSVIFFLIGCASEGLVYSVTNWIERRNGRKLSEIQSQARKQALPERTQKTRLVEGAIQVRKQGLHVIDAYLHPTKGNCINFYARPGEICCLTGSNDSLKQRDHLLKVLRKERPLEQGQIHRSGVSYEKLSWKRQDASEFIILPFLTATENVKFYADLTENYLSGELLKMINNQFIAEFPMYKMPLNKHKFLKVVIQLVAGNHDDLLILEDPTEGLDQEQRKLVYHLINRQKQQRTIVINTQDRDLIDILADQVFILTKDCNFLKINKLNSFSIQIALECTESTDDIVEELREELKARQVSIKVMPRQESNFASLQLVTENESDFIQVREVLKLKEKQLGWFTLSESYPIRSRLAQRVYKPCKEDFKVVFEAKDNQKVTNELLVELTQSLEATRCKPIRAENETIQLEFTFTKEEDFNAAVRDSDYLALKKGIVLLSLKTPQIVSADDQALAGDQDSMLKSPPQDLDHSLLPVENQNEPDLSVVREEDDHSLQRKSSGTIEQKQVSKQCRGCRSVLNEGVRQGRLGMWQLILQMALSTIFVLYSFDCISYLYNTRSESRVLSPNWLPSKQEIFINKKAKYGNVDPIEMVSYIDGFEESFKVTELETQWNREIGPFKSKIYDRTARDVISNPDSNQYGSYEFFELNTTSNRYMFTTLVNITSPHSSILFPQFMLEAVLKLATGDDDFEFKTKSTPYPIQNYIDIETASQERQFKVKTQLNQVMMIKSWTDVGLRLNTIICFAYTIITGAIVSQLVRDRTSNTKAFQIQNGLNTMVYWLIRYLWDLLKYVPVSYAIYLYAKEEETQLIALRTSVVWFPFAFLPFLYVFQHRFENEVSAQIFFIMLQILSMVLLPFATAIMKTGTATQDLGDQLMWVFRLFPAYPLSSTVMFNSEMLNWLSDQRFIPAKEKKGIQITKAVGTSPLSTDPWAIENGMGDVYALLFQMVLWWTVLLLIVDRAPGPLCKVDCRTIRAHKNSQDTNVAPESKNVPLAPSVLKTDNLVVTEPNQNQCLCIVCRRGAKLFHIADVTVRIGEVVAFVGQSGSGKTTLLRKLVKMMTPMEHKGQTVKRYMKDFSFAFQQHAEVDRAMKVSDLLDSPLKVRQDLVHEYLTQLGHGDILETKIGKLFPKERQALKIAMTLAGSQQLVILDEPFTFFDEEQRVVLASLIEKQKQEKAVIVSLNCKDDLELLNPTQYRTLDEEVLPNQPFIRLKFKLKPQSEQEARDFVNNFFEPLVSEKGRGVPLPKSQVVEAVGNSTLSKVSIEQILEHLNGLPRMIDLEKESHEFLQIFKIYKVVRLLADNFGEVFIDWQIKDSVSISFAENRLAPLILLQFLKNEFLVRETIERYSLEALTEDQDLSDNEALSYKTA